MERETGAGCKGGWAMSGHYGFNSSQIEDQIRCQSARNNTSGNDSNGTNGQLVISLND